jgi:hypothetical protein
MEYIISDLFGKIANAVGFGGGEKPLAPLSQSCQQIVNDKAAEIASTIKPSDTHVMNASKFLNAIKEIRQEAIVAGVSGGTPCHEATAQHVKVAVNAERQINVASR